MESYRELLLDVEKVKKQGPELKYKNYALVTDYLLQETIMSYYYLDIHFVRPVI